MYKDIKVYVMGMKILVGGPHHCCSRVFVALLDRHPDVDYVGHFTVPDEGRGESLLEKFNEGYDVICFASRDSTAINLSNKCRRGVPLVDDVAHMGSLELQADIQTLLEKHRITMDQINFLSIEAAVLYGDLYLKSILHQLGLDPSKYPPLDGSTYTPRERGGDPRWFSVELLIRDENKKYFEGI